MSNRGMSPLGSRGVAYLPGIFCIYLSAELHVPTYG